MARIIILLCLVSLCQAYLEEFPRVDIEDTCFGSKHVKIPSTMNDKFTDLLAIVQGRTDKNTPKNHDKVIIHDKMSGDNPTLGELNNFALKWHNTNLEVFHHNTITRHEMYPENEKIIKKLLNQLHKDRITHIITPNKDLDDIEFEMWFGWGTAAIFKPERTRRDEQSHPDHFYFDDLPRHNSEIAAYHLDRILGFRRAAPQVGRRFNMVEEITDKADDAFVKLLYVSPHGNVCFMGNNLVLGDTNHPVCGNPHIIEGSLAACLRINDTDSTDTFVYPWKRSFDKNRKAPWEVDDKYCEKVRSMPPYNSGRRLLDIMDLAVMDFLIGNMARKDYDMFNVFDDETFIIHSEFARGFTRAYFDEMSILAPIKQCCMIRASTVKTLIKYHTGSKKLSAALREAMSSDPLSPLLWEPHLDALDRRVALVLETIRNCLAVK